jgi:hypothetical protein
VAAGDMGEEAEGGGGAHVRNGKKGGGEVGLVSGGSAWEGAMKVKRYKLTSPGESPPGIRVRVRMCMLLHIVYFGLPVLYIC